MTTRELAEVGTMHVRYEAFHAIDTLWQKRKAEGMTQKQIAEKIGRDPAWVSRALGGPANWTLRTLGELAYALGGDVEVKVVPRQYDVQDGPDLYERFLGERPETGK